VEIVDDVRLLELAQEPVRELTHGGIRTSALKPLVVLFAFLPGLLVFRSPVLDDRAAAWGLKAVEIGLTDSVLEWIKSAGRIPPGKAAPDSAPAGLLTVLSLRFEVVSPESRLLLVSYVSVVLLIFALYGLAAQMDGTRVAVLAALLVCCHGEFLALNRGLPPVALALAFAVFAFQGLLAHQRSGQSWLSGSVIWSGMALSLCWMSDASIATEAICVIGLLVLLVACDPASDLNGVPFRFGTRMVLTRGLHGLRTLVLVGGIPSLVVLFWRPSLVVLFWRMLLSSANDVPTVDSLLTSSADRGVLQALSVEARWSSAVQAVATLPRYLLGFVVLGVVQTCRGSNESDAAARRRGSQFLLIWTVYALSAWVSEWSTHHGDFRTSVPWPSLLLLPLLLLAARGLDAVLQRQFGLGMVAAATLITFVVNLAPSASMRIPNPLTWKMVTGGVIAVGVLIVSAIKLVKLAGSERQLRVVLRVCAISLVTTNIVAGVRSLHLPVDDERELQAFRRQLSAEPTPSACWVISDSSIPARLQFFLRSLWRTAPLNRAEGWEEIFVETSADPTTAQPTAPNTVVAPDQTTSAPERLALSSNVPRIVVTWGSQKWPAADLRRRNDTLTQLTAPHYFQYRLLKAYRWSSRPESTR
jgi:hypothetical protein